MRGMAKPDRLAGSRLWPLLLLVTYTLLLRPVRADELLGSAAGDPCPAPSGDGVAAARCAIRCFRADPVCGVNGVTYWCGCPDAACAGVRVARRGSCEVGNGAVAGQALFLLHIVWLVAIGFAVLFGFL